METFIFIMDGPFKGTKVNFDEVLYLVSHNRYVHLVTETKRYLLLKSLPEMCSILPKHFFRRVHRQFIVYLPRIISFDLQSSHLLLESKNAYEMELPGVLIPIGPRFSSNWFRNNSITGRELPNGRRLPSLVLDIFNHGTES